MSITIKCDRVYPVFSSIFSEDSPALEEHIFECKKVQNVENSVFVTKFSSVSNVNVLNFPSIDNSEINGNYESEDKEVVQSFKETDETPKDWKRDKTFDGSPIYRVSFVFINFPLKIRFVCDVISNLFMSFWLSPEPIYQSHQSNRTILYRS